MTIIEIKSAGQDGGHLKKLHEIKRKIPSYRIFISFLQNLLTV